MKTRILSNRQPGLVVPNVYQRQNSFYQINWDSMKNHCHAFFILSLHFQLVSFVLIKLHWMFFRIECLFEYLNFMEIPPKNKKEWQRKRERNLEQENWKWSFPWEFEDYIFAKLTVFPKKRSIWAASISAAFIFSSLHIPSQWTFFNLLLLLAYQPNFKDAESFQK